MTRRIVTEQLQATNGARVDKFSDKLIKNIPADIVAAWLAVTSLIASASVGNPILWIAFFAMVVITALWTLRQTALPGHAPAITQTIISTGSFIVWAFALGGPFATLNWWKPVFGSLLLIFYTLVVALINPPEK